MNKLSLLPILLLTVIPQALAHDAGHETGSFLSGFLHPLAGPDHIAAMFAVGLWGAFLGKPAIWTLPVVFPLMMALAGAMGILGLPLPGVETGIALSAIIIGGMVLFAQKPPLPVAIVLVGLFALFHGYAHGAELPDSATPLAYSAGFVLATGLLHLSGIAVGLLTRWPSGVIAVRTGGGLVTLAGIGFLTGTV